MTYNTHPEYERLCRITDMPTRITAINEYQNRRGLVVGKFYPPHAGHHMVIDTAAAECSGDRGGLIVAVVHSDFESIPVERRIEWLKDRHPQPWIEFVDVLDNTPVEYSERSYAAFLDALVPQVIHACWNGRNSLNDSFKGFPDTLFSGEDYAPDFARRIIERANQEYTRMYVPKEMKVRSFNRSNRPISATEIRTDVRKHWEHLAPATRADMCKRVVVCGAESSGTSTLVKALRDHYKTTAVPEWGRDYEWAVGPHHTWTDEDFDLIEHEQRRSEDLLARQSQGGVLICDTDEYATEMFRCFYLGRDPHELVPQLPTRASLYIITAHAGVPAEYDGQRNNLDRREEMTEWFLEHLPWAVTVSVSGSPEKRLEQAIDYIEPILEWNFEPPIEYREEYADNYDWEAVNG